MIGDLLSQLMNLWKSQRALVVVWIAVAVYVAFFTIISWIRYEAFSYNDFDFGLFVHECWKALHGSANISLFMDVPIWGNALELISIVTSPFLLLSGFKPQGLLFFQSLALGASAIPIYLIARDRISDWLAAGIAVSYLFYPALWYSNLYEYNPLIYCTFTLSMAFYFLQQGRFNGFMLFILLSLMNRVDVGIVTFMFGIYCLVLRRPWKWVLWPSILSFLWTSIGLLVIIPAFQGPLNYESNYSAFGQGFGEIFKNMLLRPNLVWDALVTKANGKFLFEILAPVGFLSLLDLKTFLIGGLSMYQHLVSSREYEHTIYYHYTATITPFVYISAAYGAEKILGRRKVSAAVCLLPVLFSMAANLIIGPVSQRTYFSDYFSVSAEDQYKKQLLKEIPPSASVVSSFEFSPMLAGRPAYYAFHYIYTGLFDVNQPYKTPGNIEYALINFEDQRLLSYYDPESDTRIVRFLNEGRFGIVDVINSVVLFRSNFQSPIRLFEVTEADGSPEGLFEIPGAIRLRRVSQEAIMKRGQQVLRLAFFWRPLSQLRSDLKMVIIIRDSSGKGVYLQMREFCYGVFPMPRWKPGSEVIDHLDFAVPVELKPGEYSLDMAFFSVETEKYIGLTKVEGGQALQNSVGQVEFGKFRKL